MQKNGKRPGVSVIIPTHNRGWVLEEAVDSVLSQEFTDFELIVVDDGSTDETAEILKAYGSRISTHFQPHRGVSAARNAGIRKATGRYVAFLDSDDLWLPGKLGAQVDFFGSHPEVRACQTEEIWIRKGIRVNPKNCHRKLSGALFNASLERCLVSPSAVMVPKSLFQEVGFFDESLPACEDYDLWLRVSCRFPVFLIDKPLVVKRGGHADQLSRAWGLDRHRIRSLVKIIESGLLDQTQTRAAVRMLKTKCALYAGGCLKRGRLEEYHRYANLSRRFSKDVVTPVRSGPRG